LGQDLLRTGKWSSLEVGYNLNWYWAKRCNTVVGVLRRIQVNATALNRIDHMCSLSFEAGRRFRRRDVELARGGNGGARN
jgi:hypothetical protein